MRLLQLPASVLDLYYGIALSPGMLSMAVVRHCPLVHAIGIGQKSKFPFTRNGNVTDSRVADSTVLNDLV